MARFSPNALVGGACSKMQRAEWARAEAARVWFQVRGAAACWARKVLWMESVRRGWWKGEQVARPVKLRTRSNVETSCGNILIGGGELCGKRR